MNSEHSSVSPLCLIQFLIEHLHNFTNKIIHEFSREFLEYLNQEISSRGGNSQIIEIFDANLEQQSHLITPDI
jgi:hypothetical protein